MSRAGGVSTVDQITTALMGMAQQAGTANKDRASRENMQLKALNTQLGINKTQIEARAKEGVENRAAQSQNYADLREHQVQQQGSGQRFEAGQNQLDRDARKDELETAATISERIRREGLARMDQMSAQRTENAAEHAAAMDANANELLEKQSLLRTFMRKLTKGAGYEYHTAAQETLSDVVRQASQAADLQQIFDEQMVSALQYHASGYMTGKGDIMEQQTAGDYGLAEVFLTMMGGRGMSMEDRQEGILDRITSTKEGGVLGKLNQGLRMPTGPLFDFIAEKPADPEQIASTILNDTMDGMEATLGKHVGEAGVENIREIGQLLVKIERSDDPEVKSRASQILTEILQKGHGKHAMAFMNAMATGYEDVDKWVARRLEQASKEDMVGESAEVERLKAFRSGMLSVIQMRNTLASKGHGLVGFSGRNLANLPETFKNLTDEVIREYAESNEGPIDAAKFAAKFMPDATPAELKMVEEILLPGLERMTEKRDAYEAGLDEAEEMNQYIDRLKKRGDTLGVEALERGRQQQMEQAYMSSLYRDSMDDPFAGGGLFDR